MCGVNGQEAHWLKMKVGSVVAVGALPGWWLSCFFLVFDLAIELFDGCLMGFVAYIY